MTTTPIDVSSHTSSAHAQEAAEPALLTFEVRRPVWSVVLIAFAVVGWVGAIGASLVLATSAALSEPMALAQAAADPLSAIKAVAGLTLLAALLLTPVGRLIDRLTLGRSVAVTAHGVIIRQRGLYGDVVRHQPITAFTGIASRLTTTLSGVLHEVVLVHPDPRLDVVVATGTRSDPKRAAELARALKLPEVSLQDIRR